MMNQLRLTGLSIKELYRSQPYKPINLLKLVAPDPSLSLERINLYYGLTPSFDGENISDIIKIRDFIFNKSYNKHYAKGLTITAPHTHWRIDSPTIYKFSNNKYIIGPHEINDSEFFVPVSFVFSKNGPIAFEWIDQSIMIDENEYDNCYGLIKMLNDELETYDMPLGLTIDFRFKSSLYENGEASLEMPISNDSDPYYSFSQIINSQAIIQRTERVTTEQVSWHCLSEKIYDFSKEEALLLENINKYITRLSSEEAALFINSLTIN